MSIFSFIWNIVTYRKYNDMEINDKLYEICKFTNPPYKAIGHSPIAYFGWFWRFIPLNTWHCRFLGFSKDILKPNGEPYVGFMSNNKWEYIEFTSTCRDWLIIRKLLVRVAYNPNEENLKQLDEALQATLPPNYKIMTYQEPDD